MFTINSNTKIKYNKKQMSSSLSYAERSFLRDMEKTLLQTSAKNRNSIIISLNESLGKESYNWQEKDGDLIILAGSDIAASYALYKLSEILLGVKPLWFWMEQEFEKKESRTLLEDHYQSKEFAFKYRGWFINDEVLISAWHPNGDSLLPWIMAFEALMRLGGNTVIPGTDKNGRKYRHIASSMGLKITHHHAEPLGAEMFSRVYPNQKPSYLKSPELFEKIWRDAINDQKDMDVIWTLGFRGQGDVPFWENDPSFDTDQKRGALLSHVIQKQIDILKEYFENPKMGVNIYGEMAKLYNEGYVYLPDDVIRIWGDNGYGSMVSRRQGLDNPRTPALPVKDDLTKDNGMYYHASFYDLQAANHITPSAVSLDLIKRELETAYDSKIDDLIVVNASNIRPHALLLTSIATYWKSGKFSTEDYFNLYFPEETKTIEKIVDCYSKYAITYSSHEDDKASDQFYTYVARSLLRALMLREDSEETVYWYKDGSIREQLTCFKKELEEALARYKKLDRKCKAISKKLSNSKRIFNETWAMYIRLYKTLSEANLRLAESGLLLLDKNYIDSFIKAGDSALLFDKADSILNSNEGIWSTFYKNDCLTDISQCFDLMKMFMEYIRQYEDAPEYFKWQRKLTYKEEDKNVVLITNYEKHLSGYDMYLKHRKMNKRG